MIEAVLDIAKILIPALIVFATAYYLINSFLKRQLELKKLDLAVNRSKDMVPLRLQAYERLVLLMERISPPSLIPRVRQENMTAPELQFALITAIRTEFEHNYSQQIYVSENSWLLVKSVVEEMITAINTAAQNLPSEASGLDLGKVLLRAMLGSEGVLPTERALAFLRKDVQSLF